MPQCSGHHVGKRRTCRYWWDPSRPSFQDAAESSPGNTPTISTVGPSQTCRKIECLLWSRWPTGTSESGLSTWEISLSNASCVLSIVWGIFNTDVSAVGTTAVLLRLSVFNRHFFISWGEMVYDIMSMCLFHMLTFEPGQIFTKFNIKVTFAVLKSQSSMIPLWRYREIYLRLSVL
jgi:hypothetical protein